jgi:hypothetical protein
MDTLTRLLTNKSALHHSRIDEMPLARPDKGQVVLAIRRIALTTNNITYAAFGDAMRYWDFFPTGVEGWGHMPAWGFADVVESNTRGVEVGERFYGYFPIASHIVMQPVRVAERGFYDGSAHRLELTSAYNQYARCSADPIYRIEDENLQMLLRPLFITSFFLADFLHDHGYFGAKRLVFSSASSKTAYGTAHCLQSSTALELTGLTSARHKDFVEGLKCYRNAVTYDDLETISKDQPTLYVDFSGDEALRERVHRHFGSALVYDCFAGSAQNTRFLGESDLPGPKPEFYFAPVQIKKRNADWGTAVVNQRFGSSQRDFIRHVDVEDWLQVDERFGFDDAEKLIAELCAGRSDPHRGYVVVLP